ncbi:MAG: T9SS type A sorting domain-containing protein, partial [Chitinophagales bacterium]|nr:T9SS type A sorting domain-containing protein [Chitinophagales bacterium]
KIYPNPVSPGQTITVTLPDYAQGDVKLSLADIQGKQKNISALAKQIQIPANYPPGTYILRVSTPTHVWNKILTVQ